MKVVKILLNCMAGALFAVMLGLPAVYGAVGWNALGVVCHLPTASVLAGVYQEVWTGEQVKAFRTDMAAIGWLNKISSYDQYVRPGIGAENDVIHLVAIGVDPDVLLNNTTYPIEVQNLTDNDIAITLDKYQTKATRITDDELHAISYDKMASVVERHTMAVNETKYAKAIHALAPQSDTAATPVIATTGDPTADGHRHAIQRADIISMKAKFDRMKVPVAGRVLVLCPDHVQDLLLNDQKFADQYYNYTTGKISNLYGFEIYEYTGCPLYSQTGVKLAWGAVPGTHDNMASVAFFAPRMFRATGQTLTYLQEAKISPTTQENLYNIRHYFIALPKKQEAIGAIYSATVS